MSYQFAASRLRHLALAATGAALLGLSITGPAASAATGGSGSLDPTFGTGGVVQVPSVVPSFTRGAALQPNGDILIAVTPPAGFPGVERLNPDGTPDTSFGSGGFASTGLPNGGASSVAVQPDGKIVWVGAGHIAGDPNAADNFAVARFTASGALDPTFGVGGVVSISFPAEPVSDAANTVLMQPDGKLLVGGQAGVSGRGIRLFAAMVRLNANGSLDPAFGTGGEVVNTAIGVSITALGEDAAGDIFTLPVPAEYDSAGNIKSADVQTPLVATGSGGLIGSEPSMFLSDGRGLVAGQGGGNGRCDADIQVRRFLGATQDPAFAVTGIDFSGTEGCVNDAARNMATQADGKILVVGDTFHGPTDFLLARLTANGALDTSFGTNGVVNTPVGANGSGTAQAILVQPDGKILVIGSSLDAAGDGVLTLARYLP